jgi:hypothetical protein
MWCGMFVPLSSIIISFSGGTATDKLYLMIRSPDSLTLHLKKIIREFDCKLTFLKLIV